MASGRFVLQAFLLLAAATAAAHGWALWDGMFFDDHWHRLFLAGDDWSVSGLLHSTTLVFDRLIHAWWQDKPVEWRYVRPFPMLLARIIYRLSGGSVMAWHAIGILLHLANALMVAILCMKLTGRRFWSLVGGLLMVVYSHSVYAVGWLAAQNVLLQTAATLGALLCWVRAWGLNLDASPAAPLQAVSADRPSPRCRRGWLTACAALWLLALGSRETAVIVPVILAAFDLAFGGRGSLRARLPVHAVFAAVAAAFTAWRLLWFHRPMPDFYFRGYDGPGYIAWWLAKLLHYLTSAVWLTPLTVGPTGRFNPWVEVPGDCLLMLAILGVLGGGYYAACRGVRGWWIWPLWMFLSVLPVVPMLATPYNGYLPGVAFAVGMVLGPAMRDRARPVSIGRASPGVAVWFLTATTIYIPIYRPMWTSFLAAERLTVREVQEQPPPAAARELFFINLPFANCYIQTHLREVMPGPADGWRCHVLTFAPDVLRMDRPCRLEQVDDRTFRVAIEERPWFSGALGRFLIEGMRAAGCLRAGDTVTAGGGLFRATVLRADEQGVWELEFTFRQPLDCGEYAFYLGTNVHAAARVQFQGAGRPPSLQAAQAPDLATLRQRRQRVYRTREIASRVIATDLYLTGPPYPGPRGVGRQAWQSRPVRVE